MRPIVPILVLSLTSAHAIAYKPENNAMELPSLSWGRTKRPDGSTRFWNPKLISELGSNLVSLYYRPLNEQGEIRNKVGLIPPRLLKEILDYTAPEIQESQKLGISLIGYADCIMFSPSFLAEEGIDCSNLYALDREGKPVPNAIWDKEDTFVSCVNNPQWLDLQEKVAIVTAEAGFAGLMLDAFPYALEPGYQCHCPFCLDKWQRWSREKTGVSAEMPGDQNGDLILSNPLDRAFLEWRFQCYADFVKSIESSVQSKYPGFRLVMNHWADNLDFTWQAIHGTFEHPSTECWHLSLGDDPMLYLYRFGEAVMKRPMLTVVNNFDQIKPDYRYRVLLAEAMAGGGSNYASVSGEKDNYFEIGHNYYAFFRKYQDWFLNTESDARVGLLFSWKDQAWNHRYKYGMKSMHGSSMVDYQNAACWLGRLRVPWDCIVIEKGFSLEKLKQYRVLVAPNLGLVNDGTGKILQNYIKSGGRLLCIGDMGSRKVANGNMIERNQSLLAKWILEKALASGGKETYKGELAAITPELIMENLPPDANQEKLESLLDDVHLRSQIRIDCASSMTATVRAVKNLRAIHLIRYGSLESVVDRSVGIDYEIPESFHAVQVMAVSPDIPDHVLGCAWEESSGRLKIHLPDVPQYALIGVTLTPAKKTGQRFRKFVIEFAVSLWGFGD